MTYFRELPSLNETLPQYLTIELQRACCCAMTKCKDLKNRSRSCWCGSPIKTMCQEFFSLRSRPIGYLLAAFQCRQTGGTPLCTEHNCACVSARLREWPFVAEHRDETEGLLLPCTSLWWELLHFLVGAKIGNAERKDPHTGQLSSVTTMNARCHSISRRGA